MVSILKRIRKSSLSGSLSSSAPRHEKLLEDSGPGEVDPIVEGVQFKVKYLGTCPVTSDSGEEVTANAIKAILATAKRLEKKLARVEVTVSLAGVTVREQEALQCLLDLPIDSISYCSADPTYDRVFAVLCSQGDGTACHAFLTHKRKMAQAATLTIAQAFNLAYELWRNERPANRLPEGAGKPVAQSVVVTEAVVEPRPSSPTSGKEDLLLSSSPAKEDLFSSPTPPPNSLASPYSHHPLLEDLHAISLSGEEWGDGKRRGSSGENSTSWVQFGGEEDELIQKTTSDRSHQPSQALFSLISPLSHSTLSQARLPDLSSSPTSGWDSPLGTTPIKGSRLTMSRLASPVGSFSTPVGSPSFPFISQSPPSPTLLDWNKAQLTSPPRGFSTLPEPSLRAVPPLSWPTS